ncbi:DegV family protein with EDD domain [Evansella vedderi]|uniref:DegV family protein with EDD domain n=1 Tax=Evansella vedderi TaxID=38282 RepID=A0ABT9ZUF4_9BACI|nr:DegV family protein [Evansella vedderi]MDQ0254864.1 DegV family protein with EDD domain [Evansella vedderi]
MTKKIAWVTDSTAYITKELAEHPDVYILPINITFDQDTYEDGVNLTTDILYKRIREEKTVPKTSQPSVGKFAELYEKLKTEYDHAIAVHISGKLSGTIDSSTQGKNIAEFEVEIVDSKCMSYAITTLIEKGMHLAEEGKPYVEIAETLREEASQSENYILLGNLEQFYKGGRMSGAQYLLGNILQIKPIIRINTQTGEFELFERVRSEKKAVKRLIELLKKSYEENIIQQVEIMHGNVITKANGLKQKIQQELPDINIVVGEISSTIAAHAGEGTVALIWHKEGTK